MKKLLLAFVYSLVLITSQAQVRSGDKALDARLDTYMQWNRDLDFEKVMDYVHPKLFSIAPREAILQSFKQAFDNDQIAITIDSSYVVAFSPAFQHEAASYRKVDYFMSMRLRFKDTAVVNDEFIGTMTQNLQASMPGKTVAFNKALAAFVIRGKDVMIAIKDSKDAQWMFLGHNNNPQLVEALFAPEVIKHFKL